MASENDSLEAEPSCAPEAASVADEDDELTVISVFVLAVYNFSHERRNGQFTFETIIGKIEKEGILDYVRRKADGHPPRLPFDPYHLYQETNEHRPLIRQVAVWVEAIEKRDASLLHRGPGGQKHALVARAGDNDSARIVEELLVKAQGNGNGATANLTRADLEKWLDWWMERPKHKPTERTENDDNTRDVEELLVQTQGDGNGVAATSTRADLEKWLDWWLERQKRKSAERGTESVDTSSYTSGSSTQPTPIRHRRWHGVVEGEENRGEEAGEHQRLEIEVNDAGVRIGIGK